MKTSLDWEQGTENNLKIIVNLFYRIEDLFTDNQFLPTARNKWQTWSHVPMKKCNEPENFNQNGYMYQDLTIPAETIQLPYFSTINL